MIDLKPLAIGLVCLTFGSGFSKKLERVRHVDRIEVNHKFDSYGNEIFTQVIAWKLNANGEYRCVGFSLIGLYALPLQANGVWRFEGPNKLTIVAPIRTESWTSHDPERDCFREHGRCEDVFEVRKVSE